MSQRWLSQFMAFFSEWNPYIWMTEWVYYIKRPYPSHYTGTAQLVVAFLFHAERQARNLQLYPFKVLSVIRAWIDHGSKAPEADALPSRAIRG